MKRLNPLYIVLLFLIIVFISFYNLKEYKSEYNDTVSTFSDIKEKSKDYKNLTTTWENKAFAIKTIDDILKNSIFKDAKISKTNNSSVYNIRVESSNPKVLDNFLNKVLNKKLVINRLNLNKNYIDLQVGIK